jgi:chorismate synthase
MRYSLFGESHGPAIGVVLQGIPSGLKLDMDFIEAELARRAPGKSPLSTARTASSGVRSFAR